MISVSNVCFTYLLHYSVLRNEYSIGDFDIEMTYIDIKEWLQLASNSYADYLGRRYCGF